MFIRTLYPLAPKSGWYVTHLKDTRDAQRRGGGVYWASLWSAPEAESSRQKKTETTVAIPVGAFIYNFPDKIFDFMFYYLMRTSWQCLISFISTSPSICTTSILFSFSVFFLDPRSDILQDFRLFHTGDKTTSETINKWFSQNKRKYFDYLSIYSVNVKLLNTFRATLTGSRAQQLEVSRFCVMCENAANNFLYILDERL